MGPTLHKYSVRTKIKHQECERITIGQEIRNGISAYFRAVPSPFATTQQTRPVTPSHRQLNHGSFCSWCVHSSTPCTRPSSPYYPCRSLRRRFRLKVQKIDVSLSSGWHAHCLCAPEVYQLNLQADHRL